MPDFLASLLPRTPTPSSSDKANCGAVADPEHPSPTGAVLDPENPTDQIALLRQMGLVDEDYYTKFYPDVRAAGIDPTEHFVLFGCFEGHKPNHYFDPKWYLAENLDVGYVQPLLHYGLVGEKGGRCPSPLFDPVWYRQAYDLKPEQNALAHYLYNCITGQFSPVPEFDVFFYLSNNSDVAAAMIDPFEHFIVHGYKEGREPSAKFDSVFYTNRYLDGDHAQNPFLHYLEHKKELAPLGLDYQVPLALQSGPRETAVSAVEGRTASASLFRAGQLQQVSSSGLFDPEYYSATYSDLSQTDMSLLEHFFDYGYLEGRRPNPYFDPSWYIDQNEDVRTGKEQPLLHYITSGDREGRCPSPMFDAKWYRSNYNVPDDELALAHYLTRRQSGHFSPMADFDVEFYLFQNPDIGAAGIDPFEHFFYHGWRENRNPSKDFDVDFYIRRYLSGDRSQNPFCHYLVHRHEPNVHGRMPDDEVTIPREIKRFTKPGNDFEEYRPLRSSAIRQVKLLAFYLPQFHAFTENDDWWGKGFTEWTNISRGIPRFKGHYQPRIPRDLGFYSLTDEETFRSQVRMALAGGVYGFVFYYYWFDGKRLMEQPVERFLADPDAEMPFCLMWANENWTRRWDGEESEVLITQNYRVVDDVNMTADFARHFADPRYIRLQGRPLLMIYRPALIPDAAAKVAHWRRMFEELHDENPLFVMAQSFDDTDPRPYGFDGAIEFPPHKLTQRVRPINSDLEILDPEFHGKAYSYDAIVRASLEEPAPPYPLIKTAFPSWDNDARRQGAGAVIAHSTPAKYEAWLSGLLQHALGHPFFGESLICVNAWNEWCEGAYLEPDLHFGAAYLNATARAVTGVSRHANAPKLILIGHDAFPSGAQLLLLNIGRALRRCFGLEFEFLLLDGGKLESTYREVAPVAIAGDDRSVELKLKTLVDQGFAYAIINTAAAAGTTSAACAVGIEPIVLIHELPRIIREKHLSAGLAAAVSLARHLVFASPFVRDQLLGDSASSTSDRTIILPQGIYQELVPLPEAAGAVRRELGVLEQDNLILGAGYADMRKGFDLFLQLWRQLQSTPMGGRIHLVWAGGIDPGLQDWLADEIANATATGTFHMAGYRTDMAAVFSAANGFALTSREDPFPSVALEALSIGMPVIAFDRSGGIPDVLREEQGSWVVPYADVVAMAAAFIEAVAKETLDQREKRRIRFTAHFAFKPYVERLLHLAIPDLPAVSVAVPNYNYAHCIPERLASIFHQSHPVHEVIVLDDCSSDDSLSAIAKVAAEWDREIRLVPNETNSGSVFAQWRKAAELATGEFVWIAEADDLSERDFLARVLPTMAADPSVQFAFTDSRTINSDGSPQWHSYKPYYATVEADALARSDVFEGATFARRLLSVRNLILNASAVVWRRDALLRCLDACREDLATLRMAGDWRVYLEALSFPGARVAYEAQPLNIHRRHAQSVTHALAAEPHVDEIARCHDFARAMFRLSEVTCEAQDAYIAEVSEQLGIAEGATPPETDPVARASKKRGRRKHPRNKAAEEHNA